MFQDGQWPAQYGVQVIAQAPPSADARVRRACAAARDSRARRSASSSRCRRSCWRSAGTTTLAPSARVLHELDVLEIQRHARVHMRVADLDHVRRRSAAELDQTLQRKLFGGDYGGRPAFLLRPWSGSCVRTLRLAVFKGYKRPDWGDKSMKVGFGGIWQCWSRSGETSEHRRHPRDAIGRGDCARPRQGGGSRTRDHATTSGRSARRITGTVRRRRRMCDGRQLRRSRPSRTGCRQGADLRQRRRRAVLCPELIELASRHGGRVRVASGAMPGLDIIRSSQRRHDPQGASEVADQAILDGA